MVPHVNHSPGFALLGGSGVPFQADIAGSQGLAGLTAAEGKSRRLGPTVITPLQPVYHGLGSWSRETRDTSSPECCVNEVIWSIALGKITIE